MGSHSLLQGIFSTQGLNPGLLHCRQILYHLSHQESLTVQWRRLLILSLLHGWENWHTKRWTNLPRVTKLLSAGRRTPAQAPPHAAWHWPTCVLLKARITSCLYLPTVPSTSLAASRQHIKKQRHYFVNKGPSSQGYGFSSGHVWMWELDYKERWALKNWCFWTVVLEKTLEGPLDWKESQPVHPKGDQSWVFFGRTDAEAETPILWPPDVKSWLIGKDPDAGKDWGQEEKGTTEDKMVGWHHWLNGHGFGWTPGVGDGRGGLECCGSWGCEKLDTTEWLNWLNSIDIVKFISYQGSTNFDFRQQYIGFLSS